MSSIKKSKHSNQSPMKTTKDINKDLNRFAVDGQVFLSIDAEWCKNPYLSVQVAVSNKQG